MRKSRIGINIATSLLQQAVSVICGFIVPRLILGTYGANYHGILNSVSQFLSCVTLLRAGIGGVTRAALYKSLAENNIEKTSAIVKATEQFMRKIALIFSGGLLIFAAVYPFLVNEEFDWFFSFSLVVILGVSTVVQYYFGITNQFLLHTDQRLYVSNLWHTVAVILNTLFTVFLIRAGCGIHMAKLGSTIAYSLTPIMLFLYVRRHYKLRQDVAPDYGALKQRWDAFAHQLAAFVQSNTAVMVLTVFTSLKEVSVYSVYYAIVGSLNMLISSATSAVEAALGKILAQADRDCIRGKAELYEMLIHIVATVIFCCAAILIVPFVMVYTAGIHDVNYCRPLLGYLLCLAYWIAAIRMPYQNIIEAAGHFKETKTIAITEAVLNVGLSCVLSIVFGTVGVVIGTAVALGYRTYCYAVYALRNILMQPFAGFVKRVAVSLVALFAVGVPYLYLGVDDLLLRNISNFGEWVIAAMVVFAVATAVTLGVNFLFYPHKMVKVIKQSLKK